MHPPPIHPETRGETSVAVRRRGRSDRRIEIRMSRPVPVHPCRVGARRWRGASAARVSPHGGARSRYVTPERRCTQPRSLLIGQQPTPLAELNTEGSCQIPRSMTPLGARGLFGPFLGGIGDRNEAHAKRTSEGEHRLIERRQKNRLG